jgi:hypothetical protein
MWRAHFIGDPRRTRPGALCLSPGAEQHEESPAWLEAVLSAPDLVRFAWLTPWAFLRIARNPRVFERPLSIHSASPAKSRGPSLPPQEPVIVDKARLSTLEV